MFEMEETIKVKNDKASGNDKITAAMMKNNEKSKKYNS